jgi:hypothetical protein
MRKPGTALRGAMNSTQWARPETDVNCRLRRGAWYRVIDLTVDEARLDDATLETLLNAADRSLYETKARRRYEAEVR